MNSRIMLAALLTLSSTSVLAATSADGRIFHVTDPGNIYYKYVTIPQTGVWRFRTYLGSEGLDTVIHVWDLGLDQHARSNDDAGFGTCNDLKPTHEKTSCLDLQLTAGQQVIVFVRRYNNQSSGTCLFRVSSVGYGQLVDDVISPAGDVTYRWGTGAVVSWDANETIQTAYAPVRQVTVGTPWSNGLLTPTVLVLAGAERLYRYTRTDDFGFGAGTSQGGPSIWGQPGILLPESSASITPYPNTTAPYHYVVGGDPYAWNNPTLYGDGRLTFYRNDATVPGHDPDDDNLGDALEDALGTCKRAQACPGRDPRDSDEDGLRDDWETIGGCTFNGCDPQSENAINLAYYGASPMRKNLLVQVDWISHPSEPVDKWGLLAGGLSEIVEAFASEQTSVEVPKEAIRVFFDFGQLPAGGAGGNEVVYSDHVAVSNKRPACGDYLTCSLGSSCPSLTVGGATYLQSCSTYGPPGEARCIPSCSGGQCPPELVCTPGKCLPKPELPCASTSDCMIDGRDECVFDGVSSDRLCRSEFCRAPWAPCVAEQADPACFGPWPSCAPDVPGACEAAGKYCVADPHNGAGAHVCVPTDCKAPCMRHQSIHEPFNFQRMLRGSPGSAWSLMPLNRRGLFTEVWLGRGLQASEGHESSVLGTTNFRTCTWPSSGQDCMTVWPGFIELGSEEKGVPFSQEVPPGTPVDWTSTVFHELGHILGLQDGVVEFVSGAECHWDTDCAWPQRCVGSQCAHSTWQNVPNHVSSMNYYFLHRVDAVGHIDFSSGVRPRVEPFTVVASSCEDPACPDYGDPGCPLPPGRNPPGGKCCLVDGDWPTAPHYCVGPGLREDVGIGNLYDRRGNDYLANRLFQLGEMKCMTNEVGHAQGIGPAPVRLLEQDPGIDWNKNGVEDPTQVGGFVREPGHCYGGQNVHEYVDVNEWDIAWGGGFDHIGVREVPALAVVGTPLCSAIEAVECPPGFECKHGECLPALAPEAVRFSYQCAAE